MEGCIACDITAGRAAAPGGMILDTGRWVVDHCVGPLGIGTLIVKPRRHVLHVADLSAEEAAEVGALLQRVTAAVTELTSPDQVYVCLWSHADRKPGHIHFVVQPVTREAMARYGTHGPALQAAMFVEREPPDAALAAAFADRARALLAAPVTKS